MIKWYTCGQSTSRGHTEKSNNGKNYHRTKAPKDKKKRRQNPQKRQYFSTTTIKVYNLISGHVIMWYRCGESPSRGCTEKSPNGQKHNRTKAPKSINQSGQNRQKRQYFSTPTIKVYNPISGHVITITTGVDSQHHVGAQRKAPMDKSTIGQKPQRIKIKADKTPKRGNILVRQQSKCTIPFLVMWSRSQQVWTINITWAHRKKPQLAKAR